MLLCGYSFTTTGEIKMGMRKIRLVSNVRYFERANPISLLMVDKDRIIGKGKTIHVGMPVKMCWNHDDCMAVPCEFLGNEGFLLYKEVAASLVLGNAYKPRIYVSHAKDMDFRNNLYNPIHQSGLNETFEIYLPHEYSDAAFANKEFLASCQVIIAEVSVRATGQGIELGQANMMKVPIVCVYRKGTKPAGSLKTVSDILLEYDGNQDLIEKINQALTQIGLL
jgi:hypothetical protein